MYEQQLAFNKLQQDTLNQYVKMSTSQFHAVNAQPPPPPEQVMMSMHMSPMPVITNALHQPPYLCQPQMAPRYAPRAPQHVREHYESPPISGSSSASASPEKDDLEEFLMFKKFLEQKRVG